MEASAPLTLEQLVVAREKTEHLSQFLERQLRSYLETLRPLLAPRRLLGQYLRGATGEEVVGADRSLKALRARYAETCSKPFNLPPEWDDAPLQDMDGRLELYPWEYEYGAQGGSERKRVWITSPACWVVSYHSGYTLADLRQVLAGTKERRPGDVRQFVVNGLVIHLLMEKFPGLVQLLADLRYTVRTTTCADLGGMPLTTISGCVPSSRPPDDLLLSAIRMSGVPAFVELADIGSLDAQPDPVRARIEDILARA